MTDKPQRATALLLKLEANTRDDMVSALHNFAEEIARGEITKGCWGGPCSGGIYEYIENDGPTKDQYFIELDRYLESVAKAKGMI